MKVWQINGPGNIALTELREDIGPDTVKIKLTKCMLAANDVQGVRGSSEIKYPFVPGRLGVGVVSESECEVLKRGQRVAVVPYVPCGQCAACRSGQRQCADFLIMGRTCDGLLRDFAVVNKSNLYVLPDQIKDGEAVFLDYIALSLKVLDKLGLEPGQHIAVLGAGPVGMITAALAIYYQCVPILIDGQDERLDIAKDNGVYYTINSSGANVGKRVMEITGGRMCERAVFTTASGEPPQKALNLTMPGGRAVYAGFQYLNESYHVNIAEIILKSIEAVGVSDGRGFAPRAINMLANRAVNLKALAGLKVPFEDAGAELTRLAAGNIPAGLLVDVEI